MHPKEAKNVLRGVPGILAGAIVWIAGFYVLANLLAVSWPDYALRGRAFFSEGVFTFTPTMACFNLLFWVLAEIGAGWVSLKIAKRREAVGVLAGLLGVYLAAVHIVMGWSRFPWWYNLGVVLPAVPAVLLGARLAGSPRPAGAS
jgi:hypothetical protein